MNFVHFKIGFFYSETTPIDNTIQSTFPESQNQLNNYNIEATKT